MHHLSEREHATVLAALRCWQWTHEVLKADERPDLSDVATNGGKHAGMTHAEVDDLCDRLNHGA